MTQQQQTVGAGAEWPAVTAEHRPWTRRWWMGGAVNATEITRHLTLFRDSGLGGVEVSPVYGVTGEEAHALPYLRPAPRRGGSARAST
jgi:hypothetical protein